MTQLSISEIAELGNTFWIRNYASILLNYWWDSTNQRTFICDGALWWWTDCMFKHLATHILLHRSEVFHISSTKIGNHLGFARSSSWFS